ncbi:FimV/HubP family polar landmark protein [Pseudomonas sp. LRF_L74]|uniref:FimV/HubP family polar landmark protein n=1 Tax=Pseudomonas sp. LRF_L74 TaxID=3369422 RepID=UPI003F5E7771
MAPVRQIMLVLASGSLLYSGLASALGLGEINLYSGLHQPLTAEIELLQPGDLEAHEIKVQLASPEAFSRSGVERFAFLSDLRFTPMLGNGKSIIKVQSSRPVDEPYLNFIIEVARPNGNLLREYTLLIDPPGSSYIASAPSPAAAGDKRFRVADEAAPARSRPVPAATQGNRYQVRSGDSLWTIAGRVLGENASVSREALIEDIYALNPQAFSGGSRNRLRAGASLLLPDSVSPRRVVPEQQVAVSQEAAADVPSEAPAASPADDQGNVDAQLASQNAQNAELQDAISALQAQLVQLQKQMADKDEQLATIQAQLEQQRDSQAMAADENGAGKPDAASQAEPAQAPTQAAVTPVVSEETVDSGSSLWPWLLAGLGLLLALLLGAGLFKRRSRPTPVAKTPTITPVVVAPVLAEPAKVEPGPVAEPEPLAPPTFAHVAPRVPTASSDALEGANLYIAYGRFGEARTALRRAIDQEPGRMELRIRLFEVLGELDDAVAFEAEGRQLEALGADPQQLAEIRERYPSLRHDDSFADAVLHLDETPGHVASDDAKPDDFQLNLDDLSLDADWDLVSPFTPEPPVRGKVVSTPAEDDSFRSNLSELPEVFELHVDDTPVPQLQVEDDTLLDEPLDFDQLAGNREHLVTLNMALAYIDQGDIPSACNILNELLSEGDDEEKARARELLAQIA